MPELLVIDDLPELRELLYEALSEHGFSVSTAANAAEGRAALAQRRFDLLLVDAVMPGESGESLAAFAETLGVPVIVMTGHFRLLERETPPWPCLVKPFRIAEALRMIRRVLAAAPLGVGPAN